MLEAAVITPVFSVLLFASIQLFVISWRLSQVQLLASTLARQLAVPAGNGYRCNDAKAAATGFGAQLGDINPNNDLTIQIMQPDGAGGWAGQTVNCPAVPNFNSLQLQTAVLTLNYQAPLFIGRLLPLGANFTYTGVAVAVLERPTR